MNTSKDLNHQQLTGSILEHLKCAFVEKKTKNRAYSLSSFARDLDISKSILSRVLSGQRKVSLKLAMHLSTVLDLDQNQTKRAMLSAIQSEARVAKKIRAKLEAEITTPVEVRDLEVERFKSMSAWQHLAILNLFRLEQFKQDDQWIASSLGISTFEVQDALDRLICIGLLIEEEGQLKRTSKNLFVKTTKSEFAIRRFHGQMIEKAQEELKNNSAERFEKRLINGMTFVCAEEHIPMIKDKINQFQDEILAMVNCARPTELYQMNMQFFPLTKNNKR